MNTDTNNVDPKKFALIGGSLMLLMGLAALIPNLMTTNTALPPLNLESGYGYFLGIIPMNIVNKVFLIIMGIAGIACSTTNDVTDLSVRKMNTVNSDAPSVWWSRIVLYVAGALAILGLFRGTNTLGGYWPLFGNNVWVYALFAVLGGYFGYAAKDVSHQQHLHRV